MAGSYNHHNGGKARHDNIAQPKTNSHVPQDRKHSKHEAAGQKLLIAPRSDWHATDLPTIRAPAPEKGFTVAPSLLDKVHKHAQTLLDEEASAYAAGQLKTSSSYKFMSTIMGTGTWSDKVSALTLVVQESPLHTAKPLENLVGLAAKKSRDQALMALGALKDLMDQSSVLPDRKLRFFSKQSGLVIALQGANPSLSPDEGLPNGLTKQHLMTWAYEDKLKRLYLETLKILEKWCHDEIEFSRLRALDFVWELLKDKPEQEENLLRFIVNKLGDTAKKVASKASYRLCGLQETHPAMTMDIINAVESDILLRPGQSSHAKYYAIITLNQFVLRPGNPKVANRLLDVYFTLFKAILSRSEKSQATAPVVEKKIVAGANDRKRKKTITKPTLGKSEVELDEKVTAQVLTGIHRAFPYSQKDSAAFEKHFDTMFRITHSHNFNTSLQALVLIQQISTTLQTSLDRYMRTLYESLLDPRLFSSSKQPMYMNLLYRSLKDDPNVRRVQAFVKRLLQTLSLHEPPFICLSLYLIIDLSNTFPVLRSMLIQPNIRDIDASPSTQTNDDTATDAPSEPTHPSQTTQYDGRKRDPTHASADQTSLWDLLPYLTHHHPSVSLFASHILSSSNPQPSNTTKASTTPPKPDPATHTLSHFLDKFAYKNPKAAASTSTSNSTPSSSSQHAGDKPLRGNSLMQPALASSNATDSLLSTARRQDAERVNSEVFWRRRAEDVRVDEVFFHRYFGMANQGRKGKKGRDPKGKKDGKEDEVDVQEEGADLDPDVELDEDEVWKAIVGSRPQAAMEDDGEDEFEGDDIDIEGEMGEGESDDDVSIADDGDEDAVKDENEDEDESSEDDGAVPGEEDADLDIDVDMDGLEAEADGGVSIEELLNSSTPVDVTAKTQSTSKPKGKPEIKATSTAKDKRKDSTKMNGINSAPTDAQDEEADDDNDSDPFALGSNEGSSSDNDSDADLEPGPTPAAAGKRKQGQAINQNQKRKMKDEEVRAFIEAEAAARQSLRSGGRGEGRTGKGKGNKGKDIGKGKRGGKDEGAQDGGKAAGDGDGKPRKKRKLKQLPVFGSAEEWARLVDGEDGGLDD